jgi:nucleotide-binding universal stress UspA family protein
VQTQRIRINRILVPTDFSALADEALAYASFLAAHFKADICSLHVDTAAVSSANVRRAEGEVLERMMQAWDALRGSGNPDPSIRYKALQGSGVLHESIVHAVEQEEADLVVMGTRGLAGLHPFTRFFMHTNSNRATENCPVPVVTLRHLPQPLKLREILLPLDLTQETEGKLRIARSLARLFDARLHLLAVADYLEAWSGRANTLEQRMEQQAAQLRESGLVLSTEVIRHEDVARAVVDYAEEIGADLILIATAQERKLDALFPGSRAGRVMATSLRPVWSLRPMSLEALLQP